jgi:hypothetical protein
MPGCVGIGDAKLGENPKVDGEDGTLGNIAMVVKRDVIPDGN